MVNEAPLAVIDYIKRDLSSCSVWPSIVYLPIEDSSSVNFYSYEIVKSQPA